MRKQIIQQESQKTNTNQQGWLEVENLAQVEISSEEEDHPIESALTDNDGAGWKAAQPGEQTVRLVFDEPQKISRINLMFREKEQERTQEFLLRWLPPGEQSYQEIVRQQYNFSPPHSTEQVEEYAVNLDKVSALELKIIPDISGRNVRASLAQLRLRS